MNLLKINGTGVFPRPRCGVAISPDDETDDYSYSTVEKKTRGDFLEELIIQCNQCKMLVRLTVFLLPEN